MKLTVEEVPNMPIYTVAEFEKTINPLLGELYNISMKDGVKYIVDLKQTIGVDDGRIIEIYEIKTICRSVMVESDLVKITVKERLFRHGPFSPKIDYVMVYRPITKQQIVDIYRGSKYASPDF